MGSSMYTSLREGDGIQVHDKPAINKEAMSEIALQSFKKKGCDHTTLRRLTEGCQLRGVATAAG